MTPRETVTIVRAIAAACPSQAMDEHTAEMWHELLGDLTHGDCVNAVKRLGQRLRYIAASDIRAEVAAIHRERADADHDHRPPPVDPDNVPAYVEALRRRSRMVAAGEVEPTRPAIEGTPHVASGIATVRRELDIARGLDPDVAVERRAVLASVLAVKCPWCNASPGAACMNSGTDRPLSGVHPSRRSAAAMAVAS